MPPSFVFAHKSLFWLFITVLHDTIIMTRKTAPIYKGYDIKEGDQDNEKDNVRDCVFGNAGWSRLYKCCG